MINQKFGENNIEIRAVENGIFRVRLSSAKTFKETLLSKYNILKENPAEAEYTVSSTSPLTVKAGNFSLVADEKTNTVKILGGKKEISVCMGGRKNAPYENEGFTLTIPVEKDERLYGMGDESRESIMKRGTIAKIWIADITSYGPIPYLMTSYGWGILTNCTYSHTYDLAKTDENNVVVTADKGVIDFYVFIADNMQEVLNLYTNVSGKPIMLPKYAYGFTFVNNEEEGAKDLIENCVAFRKHDIPCDCMGLEPRWMEKFYDYSTDKKWNSKQFYIPYWQPVNYSGPWSFFFNMRQLGFKLSLWLCNDYDLLWEEEGVRTSGKNKTDYDSENAAIVDEHFAGDIVMDKITKIGEPWFEHLKKFVDQGATCFKMDGACQVLEHPDRLWAGKYLDDEVHNIYPVIYSKQMKEGYENYTGKRALNYTPAIYAGTQQYSATWAGDTGGGFKTLVSVLNLSLCGHTNASCDLDPTDIVPMHYGFLSPWSQLLGWLNWHHPWLLGDTLENAIRFYSKLRSSLFPYIYTMAHIASERGLAVARPLSLMYPEHPEYDEKMNQYMLGDSLLVGAFDMNIKLPEGKWYDYFTNKCFDGGCDILYTPPEGIGGALLAKGGSVIVTQPPLPYLEKEPPKYYIAKVFPGGCGEFNLYEDDGETYEYKNGRFAITKLRTETKGSEITLSVDKREGSFTNMPQVCDVHVSVILDNAPKSVMVNGKKADFSFENKEATFIIPANLRKNENVECKIEL